MCMVRFNPITKDLPGGDPIHPGLGGDRCLGNRMGLQHNQILGGKERGGVVPEQCQLCLQ